MSSINMFLSSNFPIWGFYPTRLRTFCKSLDGWLVVTGIFDSTKFPAKFGGSVIVLAEMRFFAGEGGCARSSASAGSALEGIAGEATNKLRRDSWSWKEILRNDVVKTHYCRFSELLLCSNEYQSIEKFGWIYHLRPHSCKTKHDCLSMIPTCCQCLDLICPAESTLAFGFWTLSSHVRWHFSQRLSAESWSFRASGLLQTLFSTRTLRKLFL